MKTFKKNDGSIWAFEDDGSQDHLITDDMKPYKYPTPESPTYQELRAAEYPPFQDYLDGIVKGDTKQVQDYIDACKAVKLKYPKD